MYCFDEVATLPPLGPDFAEPRLHAVDLDNDGILELVAATDWDVTRIAWSGSTYQRYETLPFPSGFVGYPSRMVPFDFDDDGDLDLVEPKQGGGPALNVVYNEEGVLDAAAVEVLIPETLARGFPVPIAPVADAPPRFLVSVELPVADAGLWILQLGDSGWMASQTAWDLPGCGSPFLWRYADFNNDGVRDLVVTDSSTGCKPYPTDYDPSFHRFSIFLGSPDPAGLQWVGTVPSVSTGLAYLEAQDFDEDGHVDLLGSGTGVGALAVVLWRGNGDGTFSPAEIFPAAEHLPDREAWAREPFYDFDGDGDVELLFREDFTVFEHVPDAPTAVKTMGLPDSPRLVADLFGDGRPSVLAGPPDSIQVLRSERH
ncbi:MAG: VCBS repeat-containing protein [Myxococcota bacterium]